MIYNEFMKYSEFMKYDEFMMNTEFMEPNALGELTYVTLKVEIVSRQHIFLEFFTFSAHTLKFCLIGRGGPKFYLQRK